MRVKLLSHIVENGGIKISRRHRLADGTFLKEAPFVKGAVIEMSDASAAKYIAAGLAEQADEQESQS